MGMITPIKEKQMEKKMDNEKETREYIGVIWGDTGDYNKDLVLRPLKGGG